ncbi:hypothetical protein [Sphingomonas sp. M1-B02]|uniref:hypothetical protein n=1 Tax=Sphingomonas sp. M1-B02 TaxID=3114300 RepID=UPI002240652F|nr:hypothetical protein [Sphingomonas sp. S6-11]UZK64903.1 hypothetical protein OKW87_10235 [Sphingomonas sp. S6-11]
MNSSLVEAPPLAAAPDLAGLEPVEKIRRRWPMILGGALTLLMIVGLARELFGSGLAGLSKAVPVHPLFYVAFALYYLGPPTFDYVIFRRLWNIPAAGIAALHKKRISNEVLLGYSGEAYFYAWARQRTQMVAAPFGAVKDVMILSAMAGNAVTLLVVVIALPLGINLLTPEQQQGAWLSIGAILLMSLPFLIFSKRVFSLPKASLWWIFGVHCARIIAGSLLIAFAWHFAMPEVPVGMWLLLSAGRLLVWRLPLIPNKELVFATFAIMLIGQDQALSELMALIAALTLVVHVALIGGFSVHALLTRNKA